LTSTGAYKNISIYSNSVSESLPFIMFECFALLFIISLPTASFNVDNKLVGGAVVRENAAPYMASLHYSEDHHFLCGAAIIHPNFVLTAAHCLDIFEPKDIRILVGTNDRRNKTELHQADKFVIHDR
jgi:secreted trypsin-like serine protease